MPNTNQHQSSHHLKLPTHPLQYFGITSLALLSLMTLALVFPFVSNKSSALDQAHWTDYNTVSSTIALSLSTAGMETTITPTATGSTTEGTIEVSINTQNAGFELYLSTLGSTTSLVNTNLDSQSEIKSIVNPTVSLNTNTWGYRINDSNEYQPITLDPALTATLPAEFGSSNTVATLHFGYNIDTALPAGQYTNTLVFSAIASPAKVQGLLGINYMQDMTTSVCHNTIGTDFSTEKDSAGSYIIKPGQEPTKQLIDLRDNKDYWVAKLADEECWMTQNLALDLNEKTLPLTSELSNVSREWSPESYTENEIPAATSMIPNDTKSWNLGKYVLTSSDPFSSCGAIKTNADLNQCIILGIIKDVSNPAWQDTYPNFGADINKQQYNAHYLLGNYYQWNTATAGSGTNLASPSLDNTNNLVNAPDSICPKGWQLPTADRNLSSSLPLNSDKSFYKLLFAYGYPANSLTTSNPDGVDGWYVRSGNAYTAIKTSNLNGANQDINMSPIYFTRAGNIYPKDGIFQNTGAHNQIWSSTASTSAAHSFHSYLSGTFIYASFENHRAYGWPVRCLAR